MFVNWLWLCFLFPPHQGKNISEDQFDCISDDMKQFAPLMPKCSEYRDELQPVIPIQNSHRSNVALPAPTLRNDQDPLQADDWAKLDCMVRAA